MSVLSTIAVLFGIPRYAQISSIVLDASVSETHTASSTITDHPVEKGANIADHVRRQPDSIVINGVISNTSTMFPNNIPGVAAIKTIANVLSNVSIDTAQTSYLALKELLNGKELITIVTTLRTYENMLLEELTVDRNASNGNALVFTARAREVRLVEVGKAQSTTGKAKLKVPNAKKTLNNKPPITPELPLENTGLQVLQNWGLAS